MFAVLARICMERRGLFSMLSGSKIAIKVFETVIQIEQGSFQMGYCFPVCEFFYVRVALDHVAKEKEMSFREGEETIAFMFGQVLITLVFSLHPGPWDFYEHGMSATYVAEGIGTYEDKKYYINKNTLETSFSGTFPSLQRFPSFSRIVYNSRVLYTDTINKIVIGMSPLMKRSIVRNKVKRHFPSWRVSKDMVRISIDRRNLLRSSFMNFLPIISTHDIFSVVVAFDGEIGEDHGAIRRELIYLLFQEMIKDPRLQSADGVLDVAPGECPEFPYEYIIGNNAHVSKSESMAYQAKNILEDILSDSEFLDDKVYFVLLGAVVGCTLLLKETFHVNFSLSFYENLLGRQFTLGHVQDTELQRNLLKESHSSKCLTYKSTLPGSLCDVGRIVEAMLFEPRRNSYDFIRFGFDCIVRRKLEDFTAFEFPFIFYHFELISLSRLKDLVVYDKCSTSTKEIQWFWEIMANKPQPFLSKFLLFVTGSGNLGILDEDSAIYLEKVKGSNELFRASSCSRRLYIPCFETKERMEYLLDYSILNTEGFHKV